MGWDDELPAEFREIWVELLEYVVKLPTFTFHRIARPTGARGQPEVVAFLDGANLAYAASIYLHWTVQPPDDLKSCGEGSSVEVKESYNNNVPESSRFPPNNEADTPYVCRLLAEAAGKVCYREGRSKGEQRKGRR